MDVSLSELASALDTVEVSHGDTALPASQLDSLAGLIGEWHAISLRHWPQLGKRLTRHRTTKRTTQTTTQVVVQLDSPFRYETAEAPGSLRSLEWV